MNSAQLIRNKIGEIDDVFRTLCGYEARFFVFDGSAKGADDADFELMISLEPEDFDEVIVLNTGRICRFPDPCSHTEGFSFLMNLCARLEKVVGCRIGFCEGLAFKDFYPITYSNRFPNEDSDGG